MIYKVPSNPNHSMILKVVSIQETYSAIPRSSHFSAFQKCLLLPRFTWSAFLVKISNIKFEPVACPIQDHAPCNNTPFFTEKCENY